MKFNFPVLVCFLLHPFGLFSQNKLGNEWITGGGGQRIVFKNNTILTNKNYFVNTYFSTGHSDICDTSGKLILSSDGYNIYDSISQYLDGGDTIVPKDLYNYYGGSTILSQSSIFLPIDSGIYYFVTPTFSNQRFADCLANNNCHFDLLLCNVIDMNANGGAGKVTSRMIPILQNANLRKTQMMACRHGNGLDWWLLNHEGDNGDVHTFLFTKDSIYDKGVQFFNAPTWGYWDIRGQSTFNSDGSLYASSSHGGSAGLVMIADFDRCYGLLSNQKVIQIPWGSQQMPWDSTLKERLVTGVCFSPNGKYLYIITNWNVYQYDLALDSLLHIAGIDTTADAFQGYECAYIGPDRRIYIGNYGGQSKQMSRIDNPDVKGVGCGFCPRCLRLDSLGNITSVNSPPCMPNYSLGAKACWPLNTGDRRVIEEWDFYPNPVYRYIRINNAKGKMKILYDAIGQAILSTTGDDIDVSTYAKGLYYMKCDNKSKKVLIECWR